MKRIIKSLLVASLLGSACTTSGGSDQSAPEPPGLVSPLEECGDAETEWVRACGRIESSAGGTRHEVSITLALPAGTDLNNLPPMVYFHPGGPGVEPSQFLDDPASFPVPAGHGILVSAGRTEGSGTSQFCGPSEIDYLLSGSSSNEEAISKARSDCFDPDDEAIGGRTTASEVADVLEVLSIQRVGVLSYSYGTIVAEYLLAGHNELVEWAILDGPVNSRLPFEERQRAVEEALGRGIAEILQSCTKGCPPELAAVLDRDPSYTNLAQALLELSPAIGSGNQQLDQQTIDFATISMLRSGAEPDQLHRIFSDALAGDASELFTLGDQYYERVDRHAYTQAVCHDLQSAQDSQFLMQGSLGDAWAKEYRLCTGVPTDSPYQLGTGQAATAGPQSTGSAPVLILNSTLDPITPATLISAADPVTRNALICTSGYLGHTNSQLPSAADIIKQFIQGEREIEQLSNPDFDCQTR